MDTSKIKVIDENGKELEFDVLFTFDSEDTNKKYVLYYDAEVEAPEVYSSIYDDEGNLYPIETPEEWEMIEEVFQSFQAEEEIEEHDCCQGEDHEDKDHECSCHKGN